MPAAPATVRVAPAPAGAARKETTMSDERAVRWSPDRREFLTIGTGLFVALSLPAAIRRRGPLGKRTFPVRGTIAEVQGAHADVRAAEDAIDAAIGELRRVETTMTRFTA